MNAQLVNKKQSSNQAAATRALGKYDWPRERLQALGVEQLADVDLLALIIRTGTAGEPITELSARLLRGRSLSDLGRLGVADWLREKGMSLAKAASLVAAFELAARAKARESDHPLIITNPRAAASLFDALRTKRQEHFAAVYLNARHQVLHHQVIFVGTLDSSLVHPREVFSLALEHHASSIIIAHNHPSGTLSPSPEDIKITQSLALAAQVLRIELLDHLLLTATQTLSLREWGVFKTPMAARYTEGQVQ